MSGILKIENLNYKDILKNVNMCLEEGTINALIGGSGSGKTSILKSIFGLVDSEGIITIKDITVDQKNINELRKNLGIYLGINVLQNKTVFLNIIEPLKNLNFDEDIAKKSVYSISKKLGIENLLYKEIELLSYAEKKVVAFAQSIIYEPSIILIDNLFDSLDNYYKDRIISYLNEIKKNKKATILFVTSNSEDLFFADDIFITKDGKIAASGTLEELTKDQNLFSKNDLNLPFIIDLSYKLKAYELIDSLIYDVDEMVDEIWQ